MYDLRRLFVDECFAKLVTNAMQARLLLVEHISTLVGGRAAHFLVLFAIHSQAATMSELQKSTLETDVKDKSSPSSDEVGYASIDEGQLKKVTRISSITTVIVAGLALFSDGYNAQIIGYMKLLFAVIYKKGYSDSISTRLSNSCKSISERFSWSCTVTANRSLNQT